MTAPRAGPRVEIDGAAPSREQLSAAALDGYGHFTAMQVRNRRVRGLDLHLARLSAGQHELFGTPLDTDIVRAHIRHALGTDTEDASVRVCVRQPADHPSIMVTVRPPAGMPSTPWRLGTVPYQRPVAHIKHLSDFGQSYYQRHVQRSGLDEALLTGPDGVICEGSITNAGFYDGAGIAWPDAPALAGITMQILAARLGSFGLTTRRTTIRVADLSAFDGAFVTNARGIAPVAEIDGIPVPVDTGLMTLLTKAYESAPWDRI
jgi:branched-subunit amino acid aminotransferase/4-amino-4-deoxychorismate lyase